MGEMTNSISLKSEAEIRESLKLISYFLQYPMKSWLGWRELMDLVQLYENEQIKSTLIPFIQMIKQKSLNELQEQYVQLFDFNSACTLYLTYLKVGEQRERGQILSELKTLYKEHGFLMTDEELPDYLPLVLEFCSISPLQISVNLLNSMMEPLEKLKNELENMKTPYVHLIEACLCVIDLLEEINQLKRGENG